MHSKTFFYAFSLSLQLAICNGAITQATGDQGGSGSAIGVDTTIFEGDQAGVCGRTLTGGNNDIEMGTQNVMVQSGDILPQVSAGGELRMTLDQANTDGAGPYTCMIDSTGTGTQWQPMQVTEQVPGDDGLNPNGQATDFPLTAAIPSDQTCTGTLAGQENVCMVRCEHAAQDGPFGGCVPVQMVNRQGAINGNNKRNLGRRDGNTNGNTGNFNDSDMGNDNGNNNFNNGNNNFNNGNNNFNNGNNNGNNANNNVNNNANNNVNNNVNNNGTGGPLLNLLGGLRGFVGNVIDRIQGALGLAGNAAQKRGFNPDWNSRVLGRRGE